MIKNHKSKYKWTVGNFTWSADKRALKTVLFDFSSIEVKQQLWGWESLNSFKAVPTCHVKRQIPCHQTSFTDNSKKSSSYPSSSSPSSSSYSILQRFTSQCQLNYITIQREKSWVDNASESDGTKGQVASKSKRRVAVTVAG